LTDAGGALWGTTSQGGGTSCTADGAVGCGTVFSLTLPGTETVVYAFKGGRDGALPVSGLTDTGGALWGTTSQGGGTGCAADGAVGCGTVFSLTLSLPETYGIHTS